MAGKPEQQISHPPPPSHIHQHQQSHYQQHYQSNNNTNNRTNLSHSDTHNLHENSVLVYVQGDNFTYTTTVDHNADSLYQSNQSQQQTNHYSGIVLPQVDNPDVYKTNYSIDGGSIVNDLETDVDTDGECCLKIIDINCHTAGSIEQSDITNDDDDYTHNYRDKTININDIGATGSPVNSEKIDLGNLSIAGSLGSARSPANSDADSLSGTSDSGVVATPSATRSALPSSAVINDTDDKNYPTTYDIHTNIYTNYGRQCGVNNDDYHGVIDSNQINSKHCDDGSKLNTINTELELHNRNAIIHERGCDSVRSDTGESAYSSSLSSPECQGLQLCDNNVNIGVGVQQAAHLVTQVNVGNSNNVGLTMNGSVVQQQQQQQHASIVAPRGWKRICTNGVIIYIRLVIDLVHEKEN